MKKAILKCLATVLVVFSCSSAFAASTTTIYSITDAMKTREANLYSNAASDIVTINFTGTVVRIRDLNGVYDLKPLHAARGYYDLLPSPGWTNIEVFSSDGRTLLGKALVKGRDMVWIYLDATGYHVYPIAI